MVAQIKPSLCYQQRGGEKSSSYWEFYYLLFLSKILLTTLKMQSSLLIMQTLLHTELKTLSSKLASKSEKEEKWRAAFCDVLKSFLETVRQCTWASGTVDELAFSTGEHKDSVRSEGDLKGVGRLFQRESGQDCVTYRSAIGYAVLHTGLHHRHGYTLSLPLFSC